jgi:hypothetical protein
MFLIRISSNPKIHKNIDIIVVDIPDTYGMLLRKYWFDTLKGYFSTDCHTFGYPITEILIKLGLTENDT